MTKRLMDIDDNTNEMQGSVMIMKETPGPGPLTESITRQNFAKTNAQSLCIKLH